MTSPRIAILGSCVTRDAFELPNVVGEVALYLARSSFPVVCSPVVAIPAPFLAHDMHAWHRTTFARFFTKSYFAELAGARPDLLILDLIDDRFDYHMAETILPGIADFLESLPVDQRGTPVDFMTDQGFATWLDGARRFFGEIRSVLPGCPILLHRARWASEDAYAERNNDILERKFRAILELDDAVGTIEGAEEYVVPDDAHQWGRQPFHYVPGYYASFNDRLRRMLG